MPRLRHVDCASPGYRRQRAGRGFVYLGLDGTRITDPETLDRIGALTIPPAWREVWICPDPYGHLQATGVDAAGRRQYRYHDRWRLLRDREKFDHMLDLGFFRIGTEGYAEQNQTYGLATIRKDHVRVRGDAVEFDYTSKAGAQRLQSVADPDVLAVVRALKRRRTGGDYTAKDFRTWAATVIAAVALAVSTGARTPTARKRAIARAYQEVAHYLGNTPAVCRASYVDPRLVDRYASGATIGLGSLADRRRVERAVLDLLDDAPAARAA